ncbi:hypothetical protein B0H11DRAFT_2226328 [Mycena galericulata]|nr:hypothetical protein B0H11DRAFT_2226328 [Mycena galericulata]
MDPSPSGTAFDVPQNTGDGLALDSFTVNAATYITERLTDASISTIPGEIKSSGVKHYHLEFKDIAHEIGHLGIVAIGQNPSGEAAILHLDGYVKALTRLLTDIDELSCKCRQPSNHSVTMFWVPRKIHGYGKKLRQKLEVALGMDTNRILREIRDTPAGTTAPSAYTPPAAPGVVHQQWNIGNVYNFHGTDNPVFPFAAAGISGLNVGLPPPLASPLNSAPMVTAESD